MSRNVAQRAKRMFRRRPPNEPTPQPPVSMAMAVQIVETAGPTSRRYSLYSPELNLIAESEYTEGTSPAIAHEYIWFGGQPVAQIDGTNTTQWTFTDHLGTPVLQTDVGATVTWRAEHEPYGQIFQLRTGENRHQPLRLPGQEAEQLNLGINGYTERSYNIFRWYRAGWGRYSQADPVGIEDHANLFLYGHASPTLLIDPSGLAACKACDECPSGEWMFDTDYLIPPRAAGWAFGGGRTYTSGTYVCKDNRLKRVPVQIECRLSGPIMGAGVGFTGPSGFYPSACGCNSSELLGTSGGISGWIGPFSLDFGRCSANGQPGGITFSIGVAIRALGAGWASTRCTTRRRR